ncbi:MAG: amidohydrolase [Deltaproteobacteria bacterium]|nr:amidohydrolase [Deltaproteobacteria bacterium]
MLDYCMQEAREIRDDMVRWRRDFHQHPELMHQEHRTSEAIASVLGEIGLEVWSGLAGTGVISLVEGKKTGKTVGLRADIDALPIQEATGLPFASKNRGIMHACGHDVHMAILLGAAKILRRFQETLNGCVKLIFQPAEEDGSGAKAMIKEGVLKDPPVDVILATHVWPGLEVGQVGLLPDVAFASSDTIQMEYRGPGGHGAHPEATRDPILAAAHLVVATQSVISRNVNPLESAVVSFGIIQGGTAHNIIPDSVMLKGTVRCLDSEVRRELKERIQVLSEKIAQAFGVEHNFQYLQGVPVLRNSPSVNRWIAGLFERMLSKEKVSLQRPSMGSEDFAYYLNKSPGAIFRLGCAPPGESGRYFLHTDCFTVDEETMVYGAALMAAAAMEYLAEQPKMN